MMHLLLNAALAFGYLLGTLLVWVGIEMYAIDHARFAPSLLSVAVGIILWALLVQLGRSIRPRLQSPLREQDS